MDIVSLKFAVLTVAAVFIYYLLNSKYRVAYLAIISCAFVASLNYLLLPYVLIFSWFNFYIGIKLQDSRKKITLYRIGIVVNVVQLLLFKYASFAIDPLFQILSINIQVSKISEIILPIGISYFTLQGIGYLINIKMGWEKPEKNFLDFCLYITFFPKFLSGPVERSNHFLPQIKDNHLFDANLVSDGLRIALFGFLKKVAVANQMAPFITDTFSNLGSANGSTLWLLLLLLPLYLYFDFSGYTDIAIGFAKMFGIDLLPNFNRPFFSENVTTFWKRFHMSLALWFGDYVFRQIIFKRRKWGIYASIYAVTITWVLFGIWHGAGWNFMLLGLLQAIAVNYEFFTRKWRYRLFSRMPGFFRKWVGRLITYLFYGGSLVFFFSPDIDSTFLYFSKLSSVHGSIVRIFMREVPLSCIILLILFFVYELIAEDYQIAFEKLNRYWWADKRWNKFQRWTVYSLILTILFVLGNEVQQFIYVQF